MLKRCDIRIFRQLLSSLQTSSSWDFGEKFQDVQAVLSATSAIKNDPVIM